MLASFFCGIPLLRSKNSTVSNSLPAVGPVPLAPYADIAHCAASPHTRIPFGELPRPDLYRISKAVYKNWRHSESFGTNNMPPSLWSVKETKTPSKAFSSFLRGFPSFYRFTRSESGPIPSKIVATLTVWESSPDFENGEHCTRRLHRRRGIRISSDTGRLSRII